MDQESTFRTVSQKLAKTHTPTKNPHIFIPINPPKPPERVELDWQDYVFSYDIHTQILSLWFLNTSKDTLLTKSRLIDGVFILVDEEEKIRCIEFSGDRLAPHTFNTEARINDRPHLELSKSYDPYSDIF